jgi:hypothetical protein
MSEAPFQVIDPLDAQDYGALKRRRSFIQKQASYIGPAAPKTAERLLAHTLQLQADVMTKRGIPPETIAAEIKSLEVALRLALWTRRHDGSAA